LENNARNSEDLSGKREIEKLELRKQDTLAGDQAR